MSLKISRSVKTPWHRPGSRETARKCQHVSRTTGQQSSRELCSFNTAVLKVELFYFRVSFFYSRGKFFVLVPRTIWLSFQLGRHFLLSKDSFCLKLGFCFAWLWSVGYCFMWLWSVSRKRTHCSFFMAKFVFKLPTVYKQYNIGCTCTRLKNIFIISLFNFHPPAVYNAELLFSSVSKSKLSVTFYELHSCLSPVPFNLPDTRQQFLSSLRWEPA